VWSKSLFLDGWIVGKKKSKKSSQKIVKKLSKSLLKVQKYKWFWKLDTISKIGYDFENWVWFW
jgi:hypothetical protein